MSLKSKLLTFILIPSVIINVQNSSSNVVRSTSTTQVNGENAKAETNIETNINGVQTTVKSNSSGQIEVENINGQVTVKTSNGITPTIVVTGIPTEEITRINLEEISPTIAEKEKEVVNIFGQVEIIWQKLLSFIEFWK
jgi:hypothetical protein